jgi:hypothetical protein
VWSLAHRVTDRDRQILQALIRFRLLTTSQLTELFFTSPSRARTRLVALHRLGLVERFTAPAAFGRMSLYAPGRLAAAINALDRGDDPDLAARRWRHDRYLALASSQRLAHLIGTNDIYVSLATHTKTTGDGLVEWLTEAEAAAWIGSVVRPDGFFTWRNRGSKIECFVEYDRGTETHQRLASKLDAYRHLETERAAIAWILFAFTSRRRETNARQAMRGIDMPVATAVLDSSCRAARVMWEPLDGAAVDLDGLTNAPVPTAAVARSTAAAEWAWRFERPAANPSAGSA